MSDPIAQTPVSGTCAACSGPLVQVPGFRTYHPAVDLDTDDPCPALLPIPGTGSMPGEPERPPMLSFDVPADQFIPDEESA